MGWAGPAGPMGGGVWGPKKKPHLLNRLGSGFKTGPRVEFGHKKTRLVTIPNYEST